MMRALVAVLGTRSPGAVILYTNFLIPIIGLALVVWRYRQPVDRRE